MQEDNDGAENQNRAFDPANPIYPVHLRIVLWISITLVLVKDEDNPEDKADIDERHEPMVENLASRNEIDREGKEYDFENDFNNAHNGLIDQF